ncbi:MAG: hypothetical protein F6K04_22240, partial [Leptolyngbya sp. SIO4C5]|nr:hypothetical protein [Leptolyngbya sp. SIO4C5]
MAWLLPVSVSPTPVASLPSTFSMPTSESPSVYARSLTRVIVDLATGLGSLGEAEGDSLVGIEN